MAARADGSAAWEDGVVTAALSSPGATGLLTEWSWQPIALLVTALLGGWYWRSVRRLARAGTPWPVGRSVVFALGLAGFVWTTNGFLQAYNSSLYWVWTSQALALLLVLPLVLLTGHPLQLARATGARAPVDRFLGSGFARVLANPLVGPALVPILSGVLFFGPVPSWAIRFTPFGWALELAVLIMGGLIVLPFSGIDDEPSSLAVALALAIGSFELVLDAIPGIALRLQTRLVTPYFDHRTLHSWSGSALHDQQLAGAVLWCASEVIDLPFLLLVFRRWIRADARDAAQVDAVLEAERIARADPARSGVEPDTGADPVEGPADVPWWLSDPAMQRRLRGPR
jgi:putative membrane protein